MKAKTYLIIGASLLLTFSMITQMGCKKEAQNQSPTCKITAPPDGQEIGKGETVTIAVDATDSDGSITEVKFFIDNIGKGSATSFPYNYSWGTTAEDLGSHTLKATAIDNNGSSISDEISVTIVASGSAPIANFICTPTSGTAPLTVNFSDQSINKPTSWQWDFGDGGISTQQIPAHTYNDAGTYTVSLTATNSFGSDSEVKASYITVNGGSNSTFTDPRDGQTYNIVTIGNQTWFADNLNYETTNSWWYDNSSANGDVYGRLYTWYAAMNACPSGWHLPSDAEWKMLEMYLGMSQSEADDTGYRGTDEGKKMKSTSGWNNNGNGTNSSGFNALPGGYHYTNGSYGTLGGYGYWWLSSEGSGTSAWNRSLFYDTDRVGRGSDDKAGGRSVRCIKD